MDFFTIIEHKTANLNRSQNELLKYFIEHSQEIKNMKIQEAAENTFTSPASIIRFCKALGFSGYSEFKNNLSLSIHAKDNVSKPKDTNITLFDDIQKTKEMINESTIDKIIDLIHNSKRIDFYGEGSSRMVCKEMTKRFRTLGYHAYNYDDSSIMYLSAGELKETDLVFAISMSGETSQVLKATNIAKARKASVISLTNMSVNSLTNIADKSLFVYSTNYSLGNLNFVSRIESFILMEYIFYKYLKKYSSKFIRNE